ncbi:MAG: DUF445 family protein [Blastocatellia bacterium]|nr:DUF445 family protein [Blastocatellia bacterium]
MPASVWLTALLQLVIAVLHGLAGAWLAVRMVFRPRQAWTLGGLRVPFTPGLIPSERELFLDTFARVIAERVLTVETVADEILSLGIRTELEVVSARQYSEQTNTDYFIQRITERLVDALEQTNNNEELANRLETMIARSIVDAVEEKYGPVGRSVANLLTDAGLVRKVLKVSFQEIADHLSHNPLARQALLESLSAAGKQIFPETGGPDPASTVQVTVMDEFVVSLSRRLNIEQILKEQLAAFSDEMIEELIYRAAGRELNMIIRFGGVVGLGVGVIQALLVVFSAW